MPVPVFPPEYEIQRGAKASDLDAATLADRRAGYWTPISISAYGLPPNDRYCIVWRRRPLHPPRPWRAIFGKSNLQRTLFEQTLVDPDDYYGPALVTATGMDGFEHYGAVYQQWDLPYGLSTGGRRGTPVPFIETGLTVAQLAEAARTRRPYLALVSATVFGPNNTCAAVWRPHRMAREVASGVALTTSQPNQDVLIAPRRMLEYVEAFERGHCRPELITMSDYGSFLGLFHDNSIGPYQLLLEVPEDAAWFAPDPTRDEILQEAAEIGYHPVRLQARIDGPLASPVYALILARNDAVAGRKLEIRGGRLPSIPGPPGSASMADFDAHMQARITATRMRAGCLAFVRDRKLSYARAFTMAEPGYSVTSVNTPFLLASVSKVITGVAIHKMWSDGLLPPPPNDFLLDALTGADIDWSLRPDPTHNPPGSQPNANLPYVTLSELLAHVRKWAPYVEPDNGKQERSIWEKLLAETPGLALPLARTDVARFYMGLSDVLQHQPANYGNYQNFNFLLLGLVTDNKSPQKKGFRRYVREDIFAPIGLGLVEGAAPDAFNHGSEPSDPYPRLAGQAKHHRWGPKVQGSVLSYFTPYGDALGPAAYEVNPQTTDSSGGLCMSVLHLARLFAALQDDAFCEANLMTLPWRNRMFTGPGNGFTYGGFGGGPSQVSKGGAWDGTTTFVVHRPAQKLSMIYLANTNDAGAQDSKLMAIADSVIAANRWPTDDLFPELGLDPIP